MPLFYIKMSYNDTQKEIKKTPSYFSLLKNLLKTVY